MAWKIIRISWKIRHFYFESFWKFNFFTHSSYPSKRSEVDDEGFEVGVMGSLTKLQNVTLATQPIASFDWSADKVWQHVIFYFSEKCGMWNEMKFKIDNRNYRQARNVWEHEKVGHTCVRRRVSKTDEIRHLGHLVILFQCIKRRVFRNFDKTNLQ